MSQSSIVVAATETHNELAIPPEAIGAIVLGILFALLVILLIFGGGREHS